MNYNFKSEKDLFIFSFISRLIVFALTTDITFGEVDVLEVVLIMSLHQPLHIQR